MVDDRYTARLDVRDDHLEVVVYRRVPYVDETEQVMTARVPRDEQGRLDERVEKRVDAENHSIAVVFDSEDYGEAFRVSVERDGHPILELREMDIAAVSAPQQYHLVDV